MTVEQKRIMQVWDDIEEDQPDRSTEYMMQATAERAGVPYDTMLDALFASCEETT